MIMGLAERLKAIETSQTNPSINVNAQVQQYQSSYATPQYASQPTHVASVESQYTVASAPPLPDYIQQLHSQYENPLNTPYNQQVLYNSAQ